MLKRSLDISDSDSDSNSKKIRTKPESYTSGFDDIVRLAKEKNKQELSRKINQEKICINVQKGIYTPVMLLAEEGDVDSVTFLMDEFNADPRGAIHGYAMGGYVAHVNALLPMSAEDVKGYLQDFYNGVANALGLDAEAALSGYLQGRHIRQAVELASVDYAPDVIAAYETGNLEAQVDALLTIYSDPSALTEIFAQVGDKAKVDRLLAINNEDQFLKLAISGYALGGYVAEVYEILDRDYHWDDQHCKSAIFYYARGGYVAEVDELLSSDKGPNIIVYSDVEGYAAGGHVAKVDEHLDVVEGSRYQFVLSIAIAGYARGPHVAEVNALLASSKNNLLNKKQYVLKLYVQSSYFNTEKGLLFLMSSIDDEELREELAEVAKNEHNTYSMPTDLLKKASSLNRLMRENNMSYAWAYACCQPDLCSLFLLGATFLAGFKYKKDGAEKKMPALSVDVFLHISSYISGFSANATSAFLRRHTQPWAGKSHVYRMGKHTLFVREQKLIEPDFPDNILSLSRGELATILQDCQSVFDSYVMVELKALLESEQESFSYNDIIQITQKYLFIGDVPDNILSLSRRQLDVILQAREPGFDISNIKESVMRFSHDYQEQSSKYSSQELSILKNLGEPGTKKALKKILNVFSLKFDGKLSGSVHELTRTTSSTQEALKAPVLEKRSLPGLFFQEMEGDGHCLYNAIGLHVGQDAFSIRKIVAAHLEHNREKYESTVNALLQPGQTFEDYINGIRAGEWGDNLELTVLMRLLDRAILVVHLDGRIEHGDAVTTYPGEPIFVSYNGHNHYDALIQNSDLSGWEIFDKMKQPNADAPLGARSEVEVVRINSYMFPVNNMPSAAAPAPSRSI